MRPLIRATQNTISRRPIPSFSIRAPSFKQPTMNPFPQPMVPTRSFASRPTSVPPQFAKPMFGNKFGSIPSFGAGLALGSVGTGLGATWYVQEERKENERKAKEMEIERVANKMEIERVTNKMEIERVANEMEIERKKNERKADEEKLKFFSSIKSMPLMGPIVGSNGVRHTIRGSFLVIYDEDEKPHVFHFYDKTLIDVDFKDLDNRKLDFSEILRKNPELAAEVDKITANASRPLHLTLLIGSGVHVNQSLSETNIVATGVKNFEGTVSKENYYDFLDFLDFYDQYFEEN